MLPYRLCLGLISSPFPSNVVIKTEDALIIFFYPLSAVCPTHFTFYVQAQILPHTNILSEGIRIQNIPPTSYYYSI